MMNLDQFFITIRSAAAGWTSRAAAGLTIALLCTSLAAFPAVAQSVEDAEEEGEEGTEEAPEHTGKFIFIKMEPLIAPVLDERTIRGNITLVLKLQVINGAMEERIRIRLPKLSDAYLNYLYRYGSSAASTGVMQLDAIVRSLQRLSDKLLGKGEVKVLIDEVSRTQSS